MEDKRVGDMYRGDLDRIFTKFQRHRRCYANGGFDSIESTEIKNFFPKPLFLYLVEFETRLWPFIYRNAISISLYDVFNCSSYIYESGQRKDSVV